MAHMRFGDRLSSFVLSIALTSMLASAAVAVSPTGEPLTNSLGMKFTTIAPGEFVLGAKPEEIAERREQLTKRGGADDDAPEVRKEELANIDSEGPQHRVTISKEYRLGTYEVTQAEFQTVMGFNPSVNSSTGKRADLKGRDTGRHPVDSVSWHDAAEFCKQLSSLADEVAAGRSYRLPTEAEWEYACRAGTTTKWYWGDTNDKATREKMSYPKLGTAKKQTTVPVGSKDPNPWGLYDMAGNVREWCADWFDAKTYAQGAVRDPVGPATGVDRVIRGGMANFFAPAWRSAMRRKAPPDVVNVSGGFRVVCVLDPVSAVAKAAAVVAQADAQLKQKGLIRSGEFYLLAEEPEFTRFVATLERMRSACFYASREVDDAKRQLQHVSAAKAGALVARTEARNTMRYSETWREHRQGVIARNIAHDALVLVAMSRKDVEQWLADAQADYDAAVARLAEQCGALREKHVKLQAKQRQIAADPAVKTALASASSGGKTTYRLGPGPKVTESLKKLEHEESVLKQLQSR